MYIHCLTKLIINEDSVKLDNPNDYYSNSWYTDSDNHLKRLQKILLHKELENSSNYTYSEIRIGKVREDCQFILFRNNIKICQIRLADSNLKIRIHPSPEDAKELEVINLNIHQDFFDNNSFDMTVHEITPVKEIQIRCIKVFTKEVKGGINNELQNQFKEYAEKINRTTAEILSENDGSTMSLSDAQEKAFESIGPLKLPFEASKKALNQKIMDLYEAIYDQCYDGSSPSASQEIIPRYYYPIEDKTSYSYFCSRNLRNRKNKNPYYMVTQKGVYDARGNITKELNTCTDLYFENIHLPKFDLQWFNAPAMISLSFVKCDVFQMPNAWKIFEENLSKLSNLHILEIGECEITEIPATSFAKLPFVITENL